MGLLKTASNNTAYAKLGIMGFAGSGKTFTASKIAIGLAHAEKKKQIAFFDTEKGSDFLVKPLKELGIELLVHKGRAFKDLLAIIKEVEETGIPLVIDSISHVWRDLCDSYQKKQNRRFLTMQDWNVMKGQWKDFTDTFINSKAHILMLGRAGHEYEMNVGEDGKKEMVKTGTKMKVEGETGFEPDLLLEMDRIDLNDKIVNRCYVLKDRSDTMNGKTIDFPKFESFKTFWESINIGGEHKGVDTVRNSEDLFDDPDWSYEERTKRKEIALEEIKALLIKLNLDGTSNEAKQGRVGLLEFIFGTASWTAIQGLDNRTLLAGIEKIKIEKFGAPTIEQKSGDFVE